MITTYKTLLPTQCEFCGCKLEWDSVNLVCKNPKCSNKNKENLKAWLLNVAPIDGLGWLTIDKCLSDTDYIYNVFDLFNYKENLYYKDAKPNTEKYLFNLMLDKLDKPTTVSQFILGLNIPGIGKIGAKALENYSNVRGLFNEIYYCADYPDDVDTYNSTLNLLTTILQDSTAAEALLKFNDFREYFNLVDIAFDAVSKNNNVNKGKVVITGSLSIKRSDFETKLKDSGWTVQSKITKDTNYLITNTSNSNTSKNIEADRLGIIKITEDDFVNKIL